MKQAAKLVVLVLAIGVNTQTARAATTLELEANLTNGQKVFSVLKTKKLSGHVGMFGYLHTSAAWSEGYAGLTYAPVSWLEAGLGYGVEQAKPSGRVGGWLWAGWGKLSACYLFEDGGSGPWHKLKLDYQATPSLKLGLRDRSFFGNGAEIELGLNRGTKVRYAVYPNAQFMTFSQAF